MGANRLWAVAVLAVPLSLAAACTSPHRTPHAAHHAGAAGHTVSTPLTLRVDPQSGAANQPVTTEIGTSVSGGTVASVQLTGPSGATVPGSMRADGSSWVPAQPLDYHAAYRATVTAVDPSGHKQTTTTSFTTMANPGGNRIGTGLYFSDGETYGIGMPIAVQFDSPIPGDARAAVERRLFVTSDPPQVGVWHWYGDQQVLFRPERYWQTGTKITVRAALGGLPVNGRYLDEDRGGSATIGDKTTFTVNNATKQMQVFQNDKLVKTFPVSLGKASTPSSSGELVIMSREASTIFDVPGEYRVPIAYAERITWDGQYIHAAPWSVADQGKDNVSHGCVNLSDPNAAWVYQNSKVGDPVTVTGTEVHVDPGDGWTVWDMDWPDYIRGSALPHADLLAQAGQSEHRVR